MAIYYANSALSNLLDPYIEGTKTCPAGKIFEGGIDIRNKYAPVAVGSKRGAVGIKIGSTDITQYFAAKGTASYIETPWKDKDYNSSLYSGGRIDVFFTFYTNGTYKIHTTNSKGSAATLESGRWVAQDQVGNYEVYIVASENSQVAITNQLDRYRVISPTKQLQLNFVAPYNAGIFSYNYSAEVRIRRIGSSSYTSARLSFFIRMGTVVDGGGGGGGGGGVHPN